MLKQFEKAEAFDTIFAAKEEEARDLTNVAIRMQHNLDLQNRLNDDFRKQIADKENQNVNCQKEIEILIKSNKRDKFKKGVIAFLVGALVGGFTHALLK